VNIEGPVLPERLAGLALGAGFKILGKILTINGLGKNPGTGCFANTTRPAKKIRLRQMPGTNCIFQGCRNASLSNYRIKTIGPVFSG
jgi:hypothetical protein